MTPGWVDAMGEGARCLPPRLPPSGAMAPRRCSQAAGLGQTRAGLLALFSLLSACSAEGPSSTHRLSLIGGEETLDTPGVVVVYNVATHNQCTGVGISERVVLTAKHCVLGTHEEDWRILVGAEPLLLDGRDAESRAVRIFTTESDRTEGEDLAALTLDRPLGAPFLSWSPNTPATLAEGAEVRVVGYGRTDPEDGATFGRPHSLWATVYDLRDTTFRADANACSGDSGAPALSASVVVGVVSQSESNCLGETSFTRIDAYRELVEQALATVPADDPPLLDASAGIPDAAADASIPDLDGSLGAGPSVPGGCGCSLPGR